MSATSIEYDSAGLLSGNQAQSKSFGDYITIFKRRINVFLTTFVSILVITIGVVFLWPAKYQSGSTILIEQQEIPQDLVRTTITSFADQRIEMIKARVMTYTNLVRIIDEFNLYEKERKEDPLEVVVDEMRDNIKINVISADVVDPRSGRPMPATIAFELSYINKNPELAQKVADKLTSLFLNENLENRKQMANEAEDFLNDEAKRLNGLISNLEKQLASFKEKNYGSLPALASLNMTILERTEQEYIETERQIREIKDRKIYLQSQLAQLNPNISIYSEDGQRILSPMDRLKTLESKYLQMSATYSKNHPDVVRTRKEIEALKSSTNTAENEVEKVKITNDLEGKLNNLEIEYKTLRQKYTEEHPDVLRVKNEIEKLKKTIVANKKDVKGSGESVVSAIMEEKPDNPAYIQLNAQLQSADAEMQSYQEKEKEIKAKMDEFEKRITSSPQVERKFNDLTRDYDNAWSKYKEIKAKQMEANLAKELESERKGERFTLIDPPRLPEEPKSPNRKAIMLFGLVLALGGAIGLIMLMESMDKTIRGGRQVMALLNVAPLAGIPYIETAVDIEKNKKKMIIVVISSIAFIIFGLAAVHFLFMPLDVLWFAAMRKYGLGG